MTESTQDATQSSRGRPRPQDTLERDGKVLALLADGGKTTAELGQALGTTAGLAYLCIYRLKRSGQVQGARVDGENRWYLAGQVPATTVAAG